MTRRTDGKDDWTDRHLKYYILMNSGRDYIKIIKNHEIRTKES
jgi:hypothetical protein